MGDTKQRLVELLSEHGYQFSHTIHTQIVETHAIFQDLKLKLYRNANLLSYKICLHGSIGIDGVTLVLALPQNYPTNPPLVSIKPSDGFSLIPNKTVNISGDVRTDTLNNWRTKTVVQTTLASLIQEVKDDLLKSVLSVKRDATESQKATAKLLKAPEVISKQAGSIPESVQDLSVTGAKESSRAALLTGAIPKSIPRISPGVVNTKTAEDELARLKNMLASILTSNRENCPFGSRCYRENEFHLKLKKHIHLETLLPYFMSCTGGYKIPNQLKNQLDIIDEKKVLQQLTIFHQAIQEDLNNQNPEARDLSSSQGSTQNKGDTLSTRDITLKQKVRPSKTSEPLSRHSLKLANIETNVVDQISEGIISGSAVAEVEMLKENKDEKIEQHSNKSSVEPSHTTEHKHTLQKFEISERFGKNETLRKFNEGYLVVNSPDHGSKLGLQEKKKPLTLQEKATMNYSVVDQNPEVPNLCKNNPKAKKSYLNKEFAHSRNNDTSEKVHISDDNKKQHEGINNTEQILENFSTKINADSIYLKKATKDKNDESDISEDPEPIKRKHSIGSNISNRSEFEEEEMKIVANRRQTFEQNQDRKSVSGKIVKLFGRKNFGFIRSDNKQKDKKDVFFHLKCVHNQAQEDIILRIGSEVQYEVNPDGAKDKPEARIVFVDRKSKTPASGNAVEIGRLSGSQWIEGVVVSKKDTFFFIRPCAPLPSAFVNKDVFARSDLISKYVLPIEIDDRVEFSLGARNREKPEAKSVQIFSYKERSTEDLLEIMDFLLQTINKTPIILGEILSCKALWLLLANQVQKYGNKHQTFLTNFLIVLKQVLVLGAAQKQLASELSKCLSKTNLFSPNGLIMKIFSDCGNIKSAFGDKLLNSLLLDNFLSTIFEMTKLYPEFELTSLLFLEAIGKCKQLSGQLHMWSLKFLRLSVSHNKMFDMSDDGDWSNIALIPLADEMMGTPLENSSHLSPVQKNVPYKSSEEYMDTYFRLLRAECFSAMQQGIKALLSGELDERDMMFYHSVQVLGFRVGRSSFNIAVRFKTVKVISGNFRDPIWATVADKDPELLNSKQVIELQFCSEFNSMSTAEAIMKLNASNGSTVMVESPQYFHSIRPVLKSLQSFDMHSFPLQREIVEAVPNDIYPEYIEDDTSVDASCLFDKRRPEMDLNELEIQIDQSILDSSQKKALISGLSERLSIIQGPPGCGKTFIGIKLVQMILSMKPRPKLPILVLTYKNHALDEFLKDALKFLSKDEIARIGGRSKDLELESCNLKNLQKETRVRSKAMQSKVANIVEEKSLTEFELDASTQELHDANSLSKLDILESLTEEQLVAMFEKAPYSKGDGNGKVRFKIKNNTFADQNYVRQAIAYVRGKHQSLSSFLQRIQNKSVSAQNKEEGNLVKIFDSIINTWMPPINMIHTLKEIENQYIEVIKKREEETKEEGQDDDDEEFDEQAIDEIMEARLAPIKSNMYKPGLHQKRIKFFKEKKDMIIQLRDFPTNLERNESILQTENLWNLNTGQKVLYLYSILKEKVDTVSDSLQSQISRLEELMTSESEIQSEEEATILLKKKVIGMTITGASIHHDLVHQVAPAIVIVEEAGEVLEPDLIAALTPRIQHLILIGDHKQLRPKVDTYKLKTKYHFDLSLMERLINNGFPYQTLEMQNRMRPEFSNLLKDIYPTLQDNLDRVNKNKELACIEKSMYFWSHSVNEKSARSHTNMEEVERVLQLTTYLLMNKCKPSEISVLSAYQGQATVIRKEMRKLQNNKPELFGSSDSNSFVQVSTIDMFQGDENKYIIISLVRSNPYGNIGFLQDQSRRCVAQSRAKCGMYIIGDKDTLMLKKNPWNALINKMDAEKCVSPHLPIQCKKHKKDSILKVNDSQSLRNVVENFSTLCKLQCGELYECKLHKCVKNCIPEHPHGKCLTMVDYKFPVCGHVTQKRCHENGASIQCKTVVNFIHQRCQHSGTRKCFEDPTLKHCTEQVEYTFPACGHTKYFKCHQAQNFLRQKDVPLCQEKIHYKFPGCNHPSPDTKLCSAIISWPCKKTVYIKGKCGHDIRKSCHEDLKHIICPYRPCPKKRSCSHACTNVCGEACDAGDCVQCKMEHEHELKKSHHKANRRIKQIVENIKEFGSKPRIEELTKDGHNAAEYFKVSDKVMKYIAPCHAWNPYVTKIEKLTNYSLEKKYEEAKLKVFSNFEDEKFHGTGDEGVKGITENGFRIGKPGMYGAGIYFATDSSKSSQEIYTKGSNKLLLCKVLLGKSKNVKAADQSITLAKLKKEGFDSVFAPRDSKQTGGVLNDEFVIFDPNQALVQYIIHYATSNHLFKTANSAVTGNGFQKIKMSPSRTINLNDPNENMYRLAEGHFYKMVQGTRQIKSITIVNNPTLHAAFEKKQKSFMSQNIPANIIFAYHGTTTDSTVIDNILQTNFDMKYARRQAHGPGNYFSEYPDTSLGYGAGLIFCSILSGKEYKGSGMTWPGYNSKVVLPDPAAGYSQMVIIQDKDQILPQCVIHL